jgi:predicted nucleic acid-binding protein
MSMVFVDTSAIYAVLDRSDEMHPRAVEGWQELSRGIELGELAGWCHNGIVIEVAALIQRRLGMQALRALHDRLLPILSVHWIDRDLHARAVSALLAADRRDVSLVDWTSFETMRELDIDRVFSFDDDFVTQGFDSFV